MLNRITLIFLINSINSLSLSNKKIHQNEVDVVMFVNGNTILNVSLLSDFNTNSQQCIVTVNQIKDGNHTFGEKIIQDSAKLAAKGSALIINTPNNEYLGNFIVTVIFLSSDVNDSKAFQYYKSFSFLITFDRQLNFKTSIYTENLNNTSKEISKIRDSYGARVYILVILSIYSSFVLLLLILRVKPTFKHGYEGTDNVKGEKFLRSMHENTQTRNLLEQLRNENYRKRAWEIYNSVSKNKLRITDSEREERTLKYLHKKILRLKTRKQSIFYSARLQSNSISVPDSIDTSIPLIFKLNKQNTLSVNTSTEALKNQDFLIKNEFEQTTKKLRDWAKSFEAKFRLKFSNRLEAVNKIEQGDLNKNFLHVNYKKFQCGKSLKNTASTSELKTEQANSFDFNFDATNSNLSLYKAPKPFISVGDTREENYLKDGSHSQLSTPTSVVRKLSISSSVKSSLNSKDVLITDTSQRHQRSINRHINRGLQLFNAKLNKNETFLSDISNEKSANIENGIRFLLTPSDSPIFQPKVKE